jgi:serine/threonine protein kinase
VLKQVRPHPKSSETHHNEGKILSYLRLVHHPNIVCLVTTFEQRGTYNLLFEPAQFDLSQLLANDSRPPALQSVEQIFIGLQGLASAIAILHEFHFSEFDVQRIGCHHDLKPGNILVDGGLFLLSDFGLSRLNSIDSDSKTGFRALNHHSAPESLDSEADFQANNVGRKSDIWAFGTIILDIITYILRGVKGVKQFEQSRRFKIMGMVFYQFHRAGTDHPSVHSWIRELKSEAPSSWSPIFSLVDSILQIEPSVRPSASDVAQSIASIALSLQGMATVTRFERLNTSRNSYSLMVELERVRLWLKITGVLDHMDWNAIQDVAEEGLDFNVLKDCFLDLDRTVQVLEDFSDLERSPSMRLLRRQVDRLVGSLRMPHRKELESLLERDLLLNVDPAIILEVDSHERDQRLSELANVQLLAIQKLMIQDRATGKVSIEHAREIDFGRLKIQGEFGSQSNLAVLEEDDHNRVLVEWIEYDRKWRGQIGIELSERVGQLARVLHAEPKPRGFSNLHCLGWSHTLSRHSFGLVFKFPDNFPYPKTLKQLYTDIPRRNLERRPPLGDIFSLAHSLANSLLQFHKVNWLHKNISSRNVCFFSTTEVPTKTIVTRPYFIGFNHSRPEDPKAFTHGPDANPEQRDYSHPDYLRDERSFRYSYDYYSLGIVLLEVGLWQPLISMASTMKDEVDQSPNALKKFLLKKYIPRLSSSMGQIYTAAVLTCLDSKSESRIPSTEWENTMSAVGSFEQRVVVPLSTCKA